MFGVQNGHSPAANERAMKATGGKKVDFASYGIVTAPESHGHAGTRNSSAKSATVAASSLRLVIGQTATRVASYWKIQS